MFSNFWQRKRLDILLFSEAAAKLDTLLAVAEKSEVFIVGNKMEFEQEKPFGMKLDTEAALVKSYARIVDFCFPAFVQFLGRDGAEGGDLAIFACTGFLKNKFPWSY